MHARERIDPTEAQLRIDSVAPGIWLTYLTAVGGMVYALGFAEHEHALAIAIAYALGGLGGVIARQLPWDRIVRSRWREAWFMAWSLLDLALIAAVVCFDGGADSPTALVFFIPIVFAGMTYPLASVLFISVLAVAGYVTLGVIYDDPRGYVLMFALTLVGAAGMALWQARNQDRRRAELARSSRTDPLTGCLNRRGFEERADAQLADAARHTRRVALILLDLDNFKAVNDTDGHAAGDRLLCWVVEQIGTLVRPVDSVGRLGGDEFAILLPETTVPAAREVGDRIGATLSVRVRASIGVAAYPGDGRTLDELMSRADDAVYRAKGDSPPPEMSRERLSWASALAHAVDMRMGEHRHSDAVADFAATIASGLGWGADQLEWLRIAATLHDVGKAFVPEHVLRKPSRLTDEEYEEIKTHVTRGSDLIARIDGLDRIVPWIRHSHEHVDGSGYPDGLTGDAIPLAARILLVADAYDAMVSDRPYRAGRAPDEALAELRACAGRQFDARCVELLARSVETRLAA
jgi:diguanylate cyclase (GGDEF)-like protein